MSALGWAAIGAGGMFALGVVVSLAVERPAIRVVVGFLAALIAAPVLLLAAALQRADVLGSTRLGPDALARFARMKRKGGGPAFVFFYSRRAGVVFVRALRKGEPEAPAAPIELGERWQR